MTAVTLPLLSTVAMEVLDVLQVTVLSVALSGLIVAVRVSESPSVRVRVVLLRVTEVTATSFFLTVTVQEADFSPALAVMVAVPSLTAVTLPLLSTVAILVSELVQVTVPSVVLLGFTVAVSVSEPPSVRVRVVLFNVTEVAGTGFFLTVTVQLAV